MCGKYTLKKWELCVLVLTVLIGCLVKTFIEIGGLVFDIWHVIIMPAIFTLKTPKRHIYIIPANLMLFVFQFVSMFVKNIKGFIIPSDEVLVGMIYSIDVIIMLALYYFYSNMINERKEKK